MSGKLYYCKSNIEYGTLYKPSIKLHWKNIQYYSQCMKKSYIDSTDYDIKNIEHMSLYFSRCRVMHMLNM